jgi:hypothetical protein
MRTALDRFISLAAVAALAWLAISAPSIASAQRGIPVNVESVPPGATVYLDSPDGAPLGTTPITAVRIPSGAHTLIFRMPNFEEARLQITVARRRETFRAVLRALGTIEVSAGNEGARGASVTIDGQPVGGGTLGSLPIRVDSLPPGRHQIQATHDGFEHFEQWVEVQGGQTVRVTAMLERSAPTTGSILVAADVQGAPIFLDGVSTGRATTTVLDDVSVGTHTVEIRGGEGTTPFSQTVLVQQGQRAEVHATIHPVSTAPTTGSIAIITDVPTAEVRINGTSLGAGVFSRDGLAAGSYIVQVMSEGYEPFESEVTVTAGQTTSVRAHLSAHVGPPGNISITVPSGHGARVIVDGGEPHDAPYVVTDAMAGTHTVIVRAEGFEDVSFTCSNAPGASDEQDCDRQVELSAQQVPFRVTLQHEIEGEAALLIDDREIGPVPYEGRIPVGNHIVEVRAEGYQSYRRQMDVQLGQGDITVDAALVDSSTEASASSTTHSALPTPINHTWVDASLGYPYLGEVRLGIGIHELFDAGFAIRTFGRITEFEGRVRFGARVIRQLALGAQLRFGGGIGPGVGMGHPSAAPVIGGNPVSPVAYVPSAIGPARLPYPVNTAFISLEGDISLLLEPVATVTLWTGLDIVSDEYAGHARNERVFSDYTGSGGAGCNDSNGTSVVCMQQRQTMARWRFGGAIEFNIGQNLGVWLIFEGILAQTDGPRRMLSAFISDSTDIQIYPRLGFTYKF